MRKALLTTAMEMMARGITPSIAELAEAAGVSRATAYRYFATQGELISAIVGESLGPMLEWQSDASTAAERVDALFCATYPRLEAYEVPLRAAIQVSLQQIAHQRAGVPATERPFVRGYRVQRLRSAAQPLRDQLDEAQFDRVVQALSLLYGTEVFLVLKDIWRLELDEILDVVRWTAGAILQRAEREKPVTAPSATSQLTVDPAPRRARKTVPVRKAAGIGVAAKKVEKLAKEAAKVATRSAAATHEADTASSMAQSDKIARRKTPASVDNATSGTAGRALSAEPRAARPPTQTSRRKPGR
ncbi:TetR/AcrR family transcriptional regulator [Pigmentiphaga aceris]|uniref:TetR/AcrR family transcriptional regulator n=2 Tax=Pigmentiphaga aceris TaxID=1940612 RepID=A0A5C0B4W2_9BURK|nr:TetR/AcrR family transcriptional regulator [Pigmentiphaga aceris]